MAAENLCLEPSSNSVDQSVGQQLHGQGPASLLTQQNQQAAAQEAAQAAANATLAAHALHTSNQASSSAPFPVAGLNNAGNLFTQSEVPNQAPTATNQWVPWTPESWLSSAQISNAGMGQYKQVYEAAAQPQVQWAFPGAGVGGSTYNAVSQLGGFAPTLEQTAQTMQQTMQGYNNNNMAYLLQNYTSQIQAPGVTEAIIQQQTRQSLQMLEGCSPFASQLLHGNGSYTAMPQYGIQSVSQPSLQAQRQYTNMPEQTQPQSDPVAAITASILANPRQSQRPTIATTMTHNGVTNVASELAASQAYHNLVVSAGEEGHPKFNVDKNGVFEL